MKDYWINENKIIFKPKFNKELTYDLTNIISDFDELIFSNYNDLISEKETNNIFNNKYDLFYERLRFNKNINNLPNSLLSVDRGALFSKKIDYLPNSVTKIIYHGTEHKINNLVNSITVLRINSFYRDKINKMPIKMDTFIYGTKCFTPLKI
jgi:hypothetical protein